MIWPMHYPGVTTNTRFTSLNLPTPRTAKLFRIFFFGRGGGHLRRPMHITF
ncbi:hypothetical protein PC119_g27778 [Phytophthora cactorum]|nr:hypothetical protein PC119_g27778 [Phytophthora cactorum]